jgi:hypothetical protein
MIELQALAELGALDRACERTLARRPRALGSPSVLAATAGIALGWMVRGALADGHRRLREKAGGANMAAVRPRRSRQFAQEA